jgi:hypothetical protein
MRPTASTSDPVPGWSTGVRLRWVVLAAVAPLLVASVLAAAGPRDTVSVLLAVGLGAGSPLLAWAGTRSRARVSATGVLTVRSFLRADPPTPLGRVCAVDRWFAMEETRRLGGLVLSTDMTSVRLPLGWWRDERRLLAEVRRFLPQRVEVVDRVELALPDLAGAASEALRRRQDRSGTTTTGRDDRGSAAAADEDAVVDAPQPLLRVTPVAALTLGLSLDPDQRRAAERVLRRRRTSGAVLPALALVMLVLALLTAATLL